MSVMYVHIMCEVQWCFYCCFCGWVDMLAEKYNLNTIFFIYLQSNRVIFPFHSHDKITLVYIYSICKFTKDNTQNAVVRMVAAMSSIIHSCHNLWTIININPNTRISYLLKLDACQIFNSNVIYTIQICICDYSKNL